MRQDPKLRDAIPVELQVAVAVYTPGTESLHTSSALLLTVTHIAETS